LKSESRGDSATLTMRNRDHP